MAGVRASVSFSVRAFGLSVVGRVRPRNEDTLAVVPSLGIVVVADGMGGAPAGEVASALAVQEVVRALRAGVGMAEAVERAHRRIRELVHARPELEGMGTTVTALRVLTGEGRFQLGHVGDSRAYRMRAGEFRPLTRDHTIVREWVEAGRISPEAERGHPMGHVLTRAVGVEEGGLEVDTLEEETASGDRFLLCSDGLVKVMTDPDIEVWVRGARAGGLEKTVQGMMGEGLGRGAPDNITVAVLAVEDRRGRA
jgi:protein phosphatase